MKSTINNLDTLYIHAILHKLSLQVSLWILILLRGSILYQKYNVTVMKI